MDDNRALTPLEVAERLKIAKNTVYELIKRGELKGYRVGKKFRVDLVDVEAYKRSGQGWERSQERQPLPAEYVQAVAPAMDLTARTAESMRRAAAGPPEPRLGGPERSAAGTFILAGQDMILDILAQRVEAGPTGTRVYRSFQGSYNGLYALYHGLVQAATAHLWDGRSGEYNRPFLAAILPGQALTVVHLAKRMVGLYVKESNPKGLKDWSDLARDDLILANRELGSGMRVLLDERLRLLGRRAGSVRGYDNLHSTHLAVASAVARGGADFGLGNEKTSRQVQGIGFIPLQMESYDLVVKTEDLDRGEFKALRDIATSAAFREDIRGLGGYDCGETGRIYEV